VWRNEKPGPGRYREFTQCDADTVGSARPEADAEMVAMAVEALEAIGLPAGSTVVRINDRKLLNGLLATAGVDDPAQTLAVLRAVDKLDRLGLEGVERLLGEGRRDESGAFTKGAQLGGEAIERVLAFVQTRADTRAGTLDRLAGVVGGSEAGTKGWSTWRASTRPAEPRRRRGPSGVRAFGGAWAGVLHRPVWELELLEDTVDERGERVRFGSVGSGGRYDDLVARFTGERVPATGLSFGVSRLAAALRAAGRDAASEARGPVVVIAFDPR
jgi:histidyl-tRNA synthetase